MSIAWVKKGEWNFVALEKDAQVMCLGALSCHEVTNNGQSFFELRVLI